MYSRKWWVSLFIPGHPRWLVYLVRRGQTCERIDGKWPTEIKGQQKHPVLMWKWRSVHHQQSVQLDCRRVWQTATFFAFGIQCYFSISEEAQVQCCRRPVLTIRNSREARNQNYQLSPFYLLLAALLPMLQMIFTIEYYIVWLGLWWTYYSSSWIY